MLEDIRRSTKGGWTYLLVGLLIVVFAVFFGVPGDACGGSAQGRKLVAEVAGTDIYTDDVGVIFNRAFGNQRRIDDAQLRQQRAQALRSIILLHLLADKARAHGLRVSDEELVAYLKDPLKNAEYRQVYGRDGGFDGALYKAYVQNQLRINLAKYEDFKRNELLATKYLHLVEMQFQATDWELADLNALRNTKVDLEFVQFDPARLAEFVPITDEDVAAYLASNAADVEKNYDDNISTYETPAKVLIRRLFIVKPEESEDPALVKAAIEKWDKAKGAITAKPESFADVAGEFSESEKETQGLMEWTTLENLDQNIAAKVATLEKGGTAEIETEYAFMLVKLEDKQEATKTTLAEVQTDIARKLLQEQKSEELVRTMIAELKTAMEGKDTLADAVATLKPAPADGEDEVLADEGAKRWEAVTVDTTGPFSLEGQDMSAMFGGQFPGMSTRTPWDRVPKVGQNPDLARDAFHKLTKEKPTTDAPYKSSGKYFFVRLAERIEPTAEQMAKDEINLSTELRSDKVQQILGAYAAVLAYPLDDYGTFLETMLSKGIESGTVKLYERNYDAIPLVKKDEATEPKKDGPIDLSKPKEEKS